MSVIYPLKHYIKYRLGSSFMTKLIEKMRFVTLEQTDCLCAPLAMAAASRSELIPTQCVLMSAESSRSACAGLGAADFGSCGTSWCALLLLGHQCIFGSLLHVKWLSWMKQSKVMSGCSNLQLP